MAGSGALIGAIARAGTAARKCFQLNSSVWASVWDVLASVWRSLGGEMWMFGKCLFVSDDGPIPNLV